MRSRSNYNLEVLVFRERGKPEYSEKNLSEQGREPTTNSTHMWRGPQDSSLRNYSVRECDIITDDCGLGSCLG